MSREPSRRRGSEPSISQEQESVLLLAQPSNSPTREAIVLAKVPTTNMPNSIIHTHVYPQNTIENVLGEHHTLDAKKDNLSQPISRHMSRNASFGVAGVDTTHEQSLENKLLQRLMDRLSGIQSIGSAVAAPTGISLAPAASEVPFHSSGHGLSPMRSERKHKTRSKREYTSASSSDSSHSSGSDSESDSESQEEEEHAKRTRGHKHHKKRHARMLNIQPAAFKVGDGFDVEVWLRQFNLIGDSRGWKGKDKCLTLPTLLQGEALIWYTARLTPQIRNSWKKLEEAMRDHFHRPEQQTIALDQLMARVQGTNEDVSTYMYNIMDLTHKAKVMDENMRVKFFIKGLKASIRHEVYKKEPATFKEATELAHKFEGYERVDAIHDAKQAILTSQGGAGRSTGIVKYQTASIVEVNALESGGAGQRSVNNSTTNSSLSSSLEITLSRVADSVRSLESRLGKLEDQLRQTSSYKGSYSSYYNKRGYTGGRQERTVDGRPICRKCGVAGHTSHTCSLNEATHPANHQYKDSNKAVSLAASGPAIHASRMDQIQRPAVTTTSTSSSIKESKRENVQNINAVGCNALELEGTVGGIQVDGVLIDTGAAVTVVNASMALKLVQAGKPITKLEEGERNKLFLQNASGGRMQPTDVIHDIDIRIEGKHVGNVYAVVAQDLHKEILVGCDQMSNICHGIILHPQEHVLLADGRQVKPRKLQLAQGTQVLMINELLARQVPKTNLDTPVHIQEHDSTPVQLGLPNTTVALDTHKYEAAHKLSQETLVQEHMTVYVDDVLFKPGVVSALSPMNVVGEDGTVSMNDLKSVVEEYQSRSFSTDHLLAEQVKQLFAVLDHHMRVQTVRTGRTTIAEHSIITEGAPCRSGLYRTSPSEDLEIDTQVQGMLQQGIIRPSRSPYSSCVVLVGKKDGTTRMAIDYRKLNKQTKVELYSMPCVNDILDQLGGKKYFTCIDLASGFWQIPIRECDIEKTAFTTKKGHWEWVMMPFGLVNASTTFQRTMVSVLSDLLYVICLVYIDDIIIFSNSYEEHMQHLELVLGRLEEAGLTIKLKKSQFASARVHFLGHIISASGIQPTPEKVKAIAEYPTPTCIKDIQQFMGMINYYSCYIDKLHEQAHVLYELTGKNATWRWSPVHQQAFDTLKLKLQQEPVLKIADHSRPFVLHTDASDKGIGVVLCQKFDDGEHPVYYYSKCLTPAQKKYSVTDKECLALMEGLKKFRPYIHGKESFTVVTDHISLKYMHTIKDLNGRLGRWALKLQPYINSMTILHRAGKKHQNADALSRAPINTLLHVYSINAAAQARQDATEVLSLENIARMQGIDVHCKALIQYIQSGVVSTNANLARTVAAEAKDYVVSAVVIGDNTIHILYHIHRVHRQLQKQVVIPRPLRQHVLAQAHDDLLSAHKGIDKTYECIRDKYYWVNMHDDCAQYVKSCVTCQQHDKPLGYLKPVYPTLSLPVATAAFERLAVDVVGPFPKTKRGNKYILTVTDYLTRWVEAFAMARQDAVTIANILITQIICRYGPPVELLSDRGAAFLSAVSHEIYELMNIRKINTSSYHPQCNGLTERFNGTMVRMLKKYVNKEQNDWDVFLSFCLWSYNTSYQSTIKEMPYYCMFGRKPRTTIDILLHTEEQRYKDRYQFVKDIQANMKIAHQLAAENVQNAQIRRQRQVQGQGTDIEYTEYQQGDLVLLHVPRVKKGLSMKLASLWKGPYTVERALNAVTYSIKLIGAQRVKPILAHVSRLKAYTQPQEYKTDSQDGSSSELSEEHHQVVHEQEQEADDESDVVRLSVEDINSEMDSNAEEAVELEEGQLPSTGTEEGEIKDSTSEVERENNSVNTPITRVAMDQVTDNSPIIQQSINNVTVLTQEVRSIDTEVVTPTMPILTRQ